MTKRRAQRAADKRKRRVARKAQAGKVRASTSVRRVSRAADDMLDESAFARVGYDPLRVPAALEWKSRGEAERLEAIEAYHRLLPPRQQPPNLRLHAALHAIVETQLADHDPPEVAQAMTRLTGEGLDRHNALHAIGSVVSEHMYGIVNKKQPFDLAAYVRDLSELTRESWVARLRQ